MPPSLKIVPVTEANWADLERLFEAKGGPSYCWCMAWRRMDNRAKATSSDRKQALRAYVAAGHPVGLLAFMNEEPVGWCSVAPRETYRKLSPNQDDDQDKVWSIACFFVPKRHRGKGIAAALLEAAAEHAFANGARVVEAYPVDADSPSYRFMGFRPMFQSRGYKRIGAAGSRRHVMRLWRD